MFNSQIQKLIRLARKTHSPLIVTNEEGNEPVVLMSIGQYEDLAGVFNPEDYNLEDFKESAPETWLADEEENSSLYGPEMSEESEEIGEINLPEDEVFAGEVQEDVQPDFKKAQNESISEEQFYLEPIE